MRAALYARVSTADQRPEAQLIALRAHASERRLTVVSEHVDHGVSGAKSRRAGLDALLESCRRGEVDVVVCVKLDRLARSVRHLTDLSAELAALGVDLVCTSQAIDTTTAAGKLLFHVLGAVGEFERDLIVERTKAGLEAARARGSHPGRPPKLDASQVARARRMVAGGVPPAEVGRMLGVSRSTLYAALRD